MYETHVFIKSVYDHYKIPTNLIFLINFEYLKKNLTSLNYKLVHFIKFGHFNTN